MALAADLRHDLRPEESAAAAPSETAELTTTAAVVRGEEVNQVDENRQEKNRPPLEVGQ